MAAPEDYVGRAFGKFLITGMIGSGFNHEVFELVDTGSGVPYVLRLRADRDELWDGEPRLPPRNGRDETRGVHHAAFHHSNAAQKGDWFPTPHYYAVTPSGRIQPITAGWRVRSALDIDRIDAMPRPQPQTSLLYACAALLMFIDAAADTRPDEEWKTRWEDLAGGRELLQVLNPLILSLDKRRADRVLTRLHACEQSTPPLTENSLIRLHAAFEAGETDAGGYAATLKCPFFRLNVSVGEIGQLRTLYDALYTLEFEVNTHDRIDALLQHLVDGFAWSEAHDVLHDLLTALSEDAITIADRDKWVEAPLDLDQAVGSALAVCQDHIARPALEAVRVLVRVGN